MNTYRLTYRVFSPASPDRPLGSWTIQTHTEDIEGETESEAFAVVRDRFIGKWSYALLSSWECLNCPEGHA